MRDGEVFAYTLLAPGAHYIAKTGNRAGDGDDLNSRPGGKIAPYVRYMVCFTGSCTIIIRVLIALFGLTSFDLLAQ